MNQTIDLNAELREWLGQRLSEMLGDNPQNIHKLYFDIREANADIAPDLQRKVIKESKQRKIK